MMRWFVVGFATVSLLCLPEVPMVWNAIVVTAGQARMPESTVIAVAASQTLEPGTVLTEDHLSIVDLPPRYLPGGAYLNSSDLVGQVVTEAVLAGEFVNDGRLLHPDGVDAFSRGLRLRRAIHRCEDVHPPDREACDAVESLTDEAVRTHNLYALAFAPGDHFETLRSELPLPLPAPEDPQQALEVLKVYRAPSTCPEEHQAPRDSAKLAAEIASWMPALADVEFDGFRCVVP